MYVLTVYRRLGEQKMNPSKNCAASEIDDWIELLGGRKNDTSELG